MKLMILDGNSIVNRAYYGVRMLNAPDGTPTNAVYGFLAILQRLLDANSPDALCVAFDLAAPTFRHRQYAGYKAQRKPMPEELAVQMPLLKELLSAMGITQLSAEGWEADDVLGTVARICESAGWQRRLLDIRAAIADYESGDDRGGVITQALYTNLQKGLADCERIFGDLTFPTKA